MVWAWRRDTLPGCPLGAKMGVGGALKDTEWGASRVVGAVGDPGSTRYLQGQLQAQVLRVVAEHGPGGAEEEVVHGACLVLDVVLRGRRAP